jgi:hypothetical protein
MRPWATLVPRALTAARYCQLRMANFCIGRGERKVRVRFMTLVGASEPKHSDLGRHSSLSSEGGPASAARVLTGSRRFLALGGLLPPRAPLFVKQ